jgi:hypothetical protein
LSLQIQAPAAENRLKIPLLRLKLG